MDALDHKWHRLKKVLQQYPDLLVAYSGGVDSTLLLKVAVDVLKHRALGVLGRSPSLPKAELESALAVARRFQLPVVVIDTHELEDEQYRSNPHNRCYFCKKELFSRMLAYARKHEFTHLADGTHADDVGDDRPGRTAAGEFRVCSPLLEAGLHKQDIRELSRRLGLPTWNKPEMACLASRFPTGTPISPKALQQVEASEAFLRKLGFRQVRVRHHGQLARIEVDEPEMARLLHPEMRRHVDAGLKQRGYRYVTVDLRGYRRGGAARWAVKQVAYED